MKSNMVFISLLILMSINLENNLYAQRSQNDWENSEIIGINKEEAHNTAIPFATFEQAIDNAKSSEQKVNAIEDHRFATAAWIHFKSTANQIRFIMARDSLVTDNLGPKEVKAIKKTIKDVTLDKKQLAIQMYKISKEDSRIGYEASNHYYYFPLDFVEKVINCEYILYNLTN